MLGLILFIILILWVFSFFSLAPRVPTKTIDLERINEIINLAKDEKFLEIWCGNAKLSLFLADKNKNNKIVWIELSPLFYIISKIRAFFSKKENLEIIYWNALNIDFNNFDVIYIFWKPKSIKEKFCPKLNSVKKKNFRIISYCFNLKHNNFSEKKYKTQKRLPIYEYKKNMLKS